MSASYEIGRDESGLTKREREVFEAMREGSSSFVEIAGKIGITKQRVGQIVNSLIAKGAVVKTPAGAYAVVVRR